MTVNQLHNPCYNGGGGCPDRTAICHTTCKRYAAHSAEAKRLNEAERAKGNYMTARANRYLESRTFVRGRAQKFSRQYDRSI